MADDRGGCGCNNGGFDGFGSEWIWIIILIIIICCFSGGFGGFGWKN